MAKKPSITTVTAGFQSTDTINNNMTSLQNAFDNTLSLDGSYPNAMGADLDMNSNDILNANIIYANQLVLPGGGGGGGGGGGTVSDDLVYSVSSVAELRALTSAVTANTIILESWHADLKLGGGVFKRVASTAEPDDGGFIIVDASNRRWVRQIDGVFSPTWFGAKGRGLEGDATYDTDGWVNILAAVGTYKANSNAWVEIDGGGLTYMLSSGLTPAASRLVINNAVFNAVGTTTSWNNSFMIYVGSIKTGLNNTRWDCGFLCNGVRSGNLVGSGNTFARYITYGWLYEGGGSQFHANNFSQFEQTDVNLGRKSLRTAYGIYSNAADLKASQNISSFNGINFYVDSGVSHNVLEENHFFNGSSTTKTFTGSTSQTLVCTVAVDSASHLKVEKNNVLLTSPADYTVSLNASNIPTITLTGSRLTTDTIVVDYVLPDMVNVAIKGTKSGTSSGYIDNGYVDIYNPKNAFIGNRLLYNTNRVSLECMYRLWADNTTRDLKGLVYINGGGNTSIPTFKLKTANGGTWEAPPQFDDTLSYQLFMQGLAIDYEGTVNFLNSPVSGGRIKRVGASGSRTISDIDTGTILSYLATSNPTMSLSNTASEGTWVGIVNRATTNPTINITPLSGAFLDGGTDTKLLMGHHLNFFYVTRNDGGSAAEWHSFPRIKSGGTISQSGSRTNSVTLDKESGAITLFSTTTTAGTFSSFTVNNSTVKAEDVVLVNFKSGASADKYTLNVTAVANGSFRIQIYNVAAVTVAEAPVISFTVIKSTTS